MKIIYLSIKDIKPYQNNPFTHTEDELNRVINSIENNTYINPIIVGKKNIIIAGHLRYEALKQLNYTDKIECIDASHLTDDQARKFRILDNKAPEIDFPLMQSEITSLYPDSDIDLILLETGIDAENMVPANVNDDFFNPPQNAPHSTRNETEIVHRKEDATIQFTISIQQYELYTALKREILKANNVKSPGELFMLFFLKSAKDFGIEL